jgi:large subunit ribosomal protein L18
MGRIKTPWAARRRRHMRLRQQVVGTEQRPRLCVFRSLHHTYAQVIDDGKGHTLASASSQELAVGASPKAAAAREVGKLVAERAKAKGVSQVVFDRGGYKYHGRVKALADAAREGGLVY